MSELREESAKFIYSDGQVVGVIKGNGTLKIYTVKECDYKDVDDLFAVKQNNV